MEHPGFRDPGVIENIRNRELGGKIFDSAFGIVDFRLIENGSVSDFQLNIDRQSTMPNAESCNFCGNIVSLAILCILAVFRRCWSR
jgi:hypothetical protein